jgi:hypothetical protein
MNTAFIPSGVYVDVAAVGFRIIPVLITGSLAT